VEVAALNTTQLAKRIDADQIDVLLDMAGHTSQHRMQLFAQRAAPVQMTYLGYPGSTGVPNIDFILGDDVVTPKGCETLYTEQVLRLPGTVFCYAPEEDYPYPAYEAKLAKRVLTFGSFNNVPKLTPHTLKLWARVLQAVPDSRLVLKAPSFSDEAAKRIFTQRLETLGVDLNRVEFRGPVGLTDMMAEYADIDIALDPVPYNGGTTSLQAMWMGVPVITQMGDHFVSRMGASFMTAAGLPDWVAKDDDGYVAIAQKMASNRKALLTLKKGLRKRLQTNPAWDVLAHTRAIEHALLKAA
jgi:predicted O-linked N-acetylglucosamine transferase (SPINDLY family)